MGFFDSFTSGVGNFFTGVGNVATGFFSSPFGQQVGGELASFGVGKLFDVIGLKPSSSGAPSGMLGTPARPLPLSPGTFGPGSIRLPRPETLLTPTLLAEELLFFQPGGPGAAVRPGLRPALGPAVGARPSLALPPPSIPATQPFGTQPGVRTIGFGFEQGPLGAIPFNLGGGPVAFPTNVQASFPPSPFALATGVPGFQQASLGGSLLRAIPGLLGGVAGGAAVDLAFAGGGGGTPMFRPTAVGARAMFFRTPNPATGQDVWFRPAGRPILWSGDVTACRRVKKVARLARRKR